MYIIDGYTIEQYPKQNKIIITMPQTTNTLTNTFNCVAERKEKLSDNELLSLLSVVKAYFNKE